MANIVTLNHIALYNNFTGDIWYISRTTGEITPNRDIFYTGTSCLSLNCLHYIKHYDEIPADLRVKWVERIIRWGDNHLFTMEDEWRLWVDWLLLLDGSNFPEILVCKESVGRFLFPWIGVWSRELFAATMDVVFEMMVVVGIGLATKMNDWFEKMADEKLLITFEKNIDDYKAYLEEKLLPAPNFSVPDNIWKDFCEMMERRNTRHNKEIT